MSDAYTAPPPPRANPYAAAQPQPHEPQRREAVGDARSTSAASSSASSPALIGYLVLKDRGPVHPRAHRDRAELPAHAC